MVRGKEHVVNECQQLIMRDSGDSSSYSSARAGVHISLTLKPDSFHYATVPWAQAGLTCGGKILEWGVRAG